jgi:ribonuclease-3
MNDINKVIDLLKIKRGWVSDALLDKALTHKSYVNESKNGSNESYEKLREIGEYILKMLCDEFVFYNSDKEQINIRAKCREFMYQSMATNILSNKCLDYVLRGKGIKNITDDKMKNKIISEVQKSLLGAIWITYIKNGNEELKEKAMQFSLNYFEKNISNKETFDYRTSLNIIRDKFKLDIIIEQCRLEGYPDNDPKYKSIITIKNSIGASIEVSAIGNSKKKSIQNTSQKALQELYDRSNDEEIKNELSKILRH